MPGDIKYKDVNSDGVINDSDRVPIGSTTRPNLIYGFGMSATWKGFDVNLHFQVLVNPLSLLMGSESGRLVVVIGVTFLRM